MPRPLPGDIPPAVRSIVDRALAKDPAARWPTAAAMAVVARQAAASLTTSIQQPAVNGSAIRPQSANPVSNRPTPSRPASGPPNQPVSGSARPPYQQIPRPVSGGQARGAAQVPPAQPYRHPSVPPMQQQPQQRPEGSGSRQVLIVLAVVLALLVLLCAGVISFLYNQGKSNAMAASVVARTGVVVESSSPASYRLIKQVDSRRSLTHASEGRQTL
jgi:eukaryotic-like serine/threonine-protein kinase